MYNQVKVKRIANKYFLQNAFSVFAPSDMITVITQNIYLGSQKISKSCHCRNNHLSYTYVYILIPASHRLQLQQILFVFVRTAL